MLCPNNLDFAKCYNKIVFLDGILDKSYISEINSISNAEIFVPSEDINEVELFKNLKLDRQEISNFYFNLSKIENNLFNNLMGIYSKIIKELKYNFNFNNFLIYYYILMELNIVVPYDVDGLYSFRINKNIKTELAKSNIYNTANLIRRIYG